MKTTATVCFRLGLGAGFLGHAVAKAAPAAPAAPTSSPDAAAKPYVLFMRTDVSVEQNKKLYPIKDVSGRDFIVSMGGRKATVAMTGGQHGIEFQHVLTLAPATASLTGLKTERAYTPGTDPRMVRQREAAMTSAVMGDNRSLAEGQYLKYHAGGYFGTSATTGGGGGAVGGPGGEGAGAAAAGIAAGRQASEGRAAPELPNDALDQYSKANVAFSSMIQAESMMSSELAQGSGGRQRAETDLAKQMFDAVEIRFEVSSKDYLEKPYLVVITRFHEHDAKPGMTRSGVFAKALESIGSQPTKINVLHGGFPPGFEIEEVQVHLYNEGKEIPTDVAQKRVPLTRDEAFEYLQIDYLRGHKDDTLAASPAVGRPERLELARLGPKQREAVYFVKVDKNGRPHGAFLDEECNQPVDDTIGTLAQNIRYYPAMNKGVLVDGIARLSLSHLTL